MISSKIKHAPNVFAFTERGGFMEQKRKYKRFYFNGDVALKTNNGSTRLLRGYINDIN